MASSGGSASSAPLGRAPSGTITFVFTDVEGSTRRWERYGGEMQSAMRRHDELLREALRVHGGHVFKTVGDAFCAAFARADDAVGAALAVQRALDAEDFADVDGLRVRIAIHTGVAETRDGGYFGPALSRVARLVALGSGGQTLLSRSTEELARESLAEGATLEDLGEYRLRDLDRTERVFQLSGPGLEHVFPPLRSGATAATNLPTPPSSFVGREMQLADVQDLLAEHRLVTIVGTGGVGKTRFAIRLADTMRAYQADGAWFVDLADVVDPALVVAELGSTLGVRGTNDRPLLETLSFALAEKRMLVVVDTCEHVVEAAAAAVAYLLARCAHLVVLATSREALRVDGEQVYALAPLDAPAPSDVAPSAAEAMRHSAIVLLLDRARAAGSRFRLTDENAAATSQLCRELDALPFALELAASRMTLMSPQQMLDSLAAHDDAIASRSRPASRRTSILETLIGWSHALLTEPEQTLFRRLSIFAGSWTIDRATSVAGFDGLAPDDVHEHLASLVEKAMVVAASGPGEPRFRFLESTRRYAAARMYESGESATVRRRLRAAMAAFARDAEARLPSMDERVWLDEIEADVENVRAVLAFALDAGGDVESAADVVSRLAFFWHLRRPKEGIAWLAAIRARLAEISENAAARLLTVSARIEVDYGSGTPFARAAVACARSGGDPETLASALEYLGQNLIDARDFAEAEAALDEALATLPEATTARARALRGFARLYGRDDRMRAGADFEAALAILDAAQRRRDAAVALRGLAQIAVRDRRFDDAIAHVEGAMLRCEGLDDRRGNGLLRFEQAATLVEACAYDAARESALEAMQLLYEGGLVAGFADAAVIFGAACAALDERVSAALVFGYARDGTTFRPWGPQARALLETVLSPLQHDPELAAAIERGAAFATAPEGLLKAVRDRAAVAVPR